MSLDNLSYIGHYGNFMKLGDIKQDESKTDNPHVMSLYNNAFDFEGTAELLSVPGLFSAGNKDFAEVGSNLNSILNNSHNIRMLTFGFDSVFTVGQSGLLPDLQALSVFKYMDLANMVSGLKLPSVVALPLGSGMKR